MTGTTGEYMSEYAQIVRDLRETGRSDLEGEFFRMDDCRLSPRPQAAMKIVCAGQSEAGMAFTATYADFDFDDVLRGMDDFATRHPPPMQTRRRVTDAAVTLAEVA